MAELPTGTVTFLFTDIEGSTRWWQDEPEAMRAVLARHDEILRAAIETHGGHYVKTTGDGAHAVFATASDGIDAALAAQVAIVAEEWPLPSPLRVRMGLHSGPAELRDGDYYGTTVNRAARIMSVAHGGQVVLSLAAQELARDDGVEFLDLGEHRLKDLGHPERIFQVVDPALDHDFPALRSLDTFRTNLPTQLTSFVGREEELAGVAKALDEQRLVTLTGVGGVGKTRLSLQVAADVLPGFRDGAWLCELSPADDAETMAQVVVAALGMTPRPGMSSVESIADYLRPKELLLVLDNCEQLIGPTGALAEQVLRECPGVRILATSREGLGIDGERVWPLRSLPLPDANEPVAIAATSDAVALFAERAAAVRATFALDASNTAAVVEICRRLDGIPLALELAAARIVSLSPAEIAGLLDERFRLLTGRRKAVERHQTLRAAVDWSYSLLAEQECIVFDRLGVFAGSFDLSAAQAVVVGDGVEGWDVVDALTELVAKSMVVADDTPDGTTRYQMLETLSQYARERLDETGDAEHWRRRHAEHFAAWAEAAGPALDGPDEFAWRKRLDAELDNLRAAVTWAFDRGDPDDITLALRTIGALAMEANDNQTAGIGAWADRGLPHAARTTPQLRCAVTTAAACHHRSLGNYEHAKQLAQQAIELGIPSGAPALTMALIATSNLTWALGEAPESLATARERAQIVDRDFPDSVWAAWARFYVMQTAMQIGDRVTARIEAEAALRLARQTANPSVLAAALTSYGWAQIADDPTAALDAFDESIALHRRGAQPTAFGWTLCLSAGVRARTGDVPQAARDLREAVERAHQNSARLTLYTALLWGIHILIVLDHLEEAAVFDGMASTGLTPEYRAEPAWTHLNNTIERARAAFGADRYEAAFRTGAHMPHDQVVQHTLRVLDDLIAELDHTPIA